MAMIEIAEEQYLMPPKLSNPPFFILLRHRIGWVVLSAAAGAILAIVFLRSTQYLYSATLRVTPVLSQSSTSSSGLSTLANLAGVSVGRGDAVKPFVLYLQLLRSREVAAALARDQVLLRHVFAKSWDGREWREPASMTRGITQGLRATLGSPIAAWQPPAAVEVDRWLARRLTVAEEPKNGLATISLDDPDPKFALHTLARIHLLADDGLRRRKLQQTSAYISYLERTLATVTLAEHRTALATILGGQEKDHMIASSEATAYAAEPLGEVVVSDTPTSPDPWLTVAGGIILGAVVGALAAVNIKRWVR